MRQNFRRAQAFLLLIVLTGSGWGAAWAASAAEAGGSLSLNQAIDIALKEHPAVKQYRETAAAARYNIGVARAAYLPQVNFVAIIITATPIPGYSTKPGTAGASGTAGSIGGLGVTRFLSLSVSGQPTDLRFWQDPRPDRRVPGFFRRSRSRITPAAGNRWRWTPAPPISAIWRPSGPRKSRKRRCGKTRTLLKQAQGFYQVGLKAKIDVTKAEANLYQAEANLIQGQK